MTFTDPIGDMFSRIRNGQMRSLNSVEIPSSKFRKNILEILKTEGYIKDYFIEKTENNKISLRVSLKYYEFSSFHLIQIISQQYLFVAVVQNSINFRFLQHS